jgi:hypothetical protein
MGTNRIGMVRWNDKPLLRALHLYWLNSRPIDGATLADIARLTHPHPVVRPLTSERPLIRLMVPQSHLHVHAENEHLGRPSADRYRKLPSLPRTSHRPNLLPVNCSAATILLSLHAHRLF